MATYWTNSDGLRVRFGTNDAQPVPGVVNGAGSEKEIKYELVGTDLGTAVLDRDIMHGAIIPDGAVITRATLYVTTAFTSGGAATLTIGTYKVSDNTALDADGIDAAIAITAIDADGDWFECDGAQVATPSAITADCYLAAIYGTAAFTAGQATLVIRYVVAE